MLLISTSLAAKIYADEEPIQPQQPNVENISVEEAAVVIEQYNQEVGIYNEQVDEYNKQIDENYQKELEDYQQEIQKVANHNLAEDEKVAQVEAHNEEEDEKVLKSQEELAVVEAKVEADKPGSTVENFTTNPEDLPTDWSDTSEELHTIKIEEAEEKSGEEVSIINLHLYLEGEQAPSEIFDGSQLTNNNFVLTQNVKNSLLFAEWEVATFDLNDKVTTLSEGEIYKDDKIRHDGKNYKMQDYDARFIRNIEDYTQGVWTHSSEVASNSNTLEDGWGYDFDTQTGKGGETYTFEFTPEERTQYYLDNGQLKSENITVRTVDKTEPKNILSIFVYMFQRIWDEPVEYEPDYQEYTPEYMEEPEAPIKGEYLEKLETMEVPKAPAKDEPTPGDDPIIYVEPKKPTPEPPTREIPTTPQEPQVEEIIDEGIGVEEIDDGDVPLTDYMPINYWALINLIACILSVIIALIMIITSFRKEKHYDEKGEEEYKTLYSKITGLLPAILGVIMFIMTEDMRNTMRLIDKWTIPMLLVLLISLSLLYITRRKDEENKNEYAPS